MCYNISLTCIFFYKKQFKNRGIEMNVGHKNLKIYKVENLMEPQT